MNFFHKFLPIILRIHTMNPQQLLKKQFYHLLDRLNEQKLTIPYEKEYKICFNKILYFYLKAKQNELNTLTDDVLLYACIYLIKASCIKQHQDLELLSLSCLRIASKFLGFDLILHETRVKEIDKYTFEILADFDYKVRLVTFLDLLSEKKNFKSKVTEMNIFSDKIYLFNVIVGICSNPKMITLKQIELGRLVFYSYYRMNLHLPKRFNKIIPNFHTKVGNVITSCYPYFNRLEKYDLERLSYLLNCEKCEIKNLLFSSLNDKLKNLNSFKKFNATLEVYNQILKILE